MFFFNQSNYLKTYLFLKAKCPVKALQILHRRVPKLMRPMYSYLKILRSSHDLMALELHSNFGALELHSNFGALSGSLRSLIGQEQQRKKPFCTGSFFTKSIINSEASSTFFLIGFLWRSKRLAQTFLIVANR